jgi:polyphosphate kinase
MNSNRLRTRARTEVPREPHPADPSRFYNRELSWLQFNRRVLEEAQNPRHPVLERLRFLSISASNLDEFYMVRVAGLHGQVLAKVQTTSQDGLTPEQQIVEINRFVTRLSGEQQAAWSALSGEMEKSGITIVEPKQLTAAETTWRIPSHSFRIEDSRSDWSSSATTRRRRCMP